MHTISFILHLQAFGFLSCILFIVDLVLNYRKFQAQKEQESSPDQARDASTRRRVWDINYEYLRTSVFRIKFAEMVINQHCSTIFYFLYGPFIQSWLTGSTRSNHLNLCMIFNALIGKSGLGSLSGVEISVTRSRESLHLMTDFLHLLTLGRCF